MTFTASTQKTSSGSVLRIHASGEILVESVREFLIAVEYAYNSAYVLDRIIEQAQQARQRSDSMPPMPLSTMLWNFWWPPTEEKVAALVPADDKLKLKGVVLQSPGFWDFMGTLNPLEVLRNLINDRHEHQKDREYRNAREAERLNLENELLKTKVIDEKFNVLKNAGATSYEIQMLREQLLGKSFRSLAAIQDNRQIVNAEIINSEKEYFDQDMSVLPPSSMSIPLLKAKFSPKGSKKLESSNQVGEAFEVSLGEKGVIEKNGKNYILLIYALYKYNQLSAIEKEIANCHLGIPDNIFEPAISLEDVAKRGNYNALELKNAYDDMLSRSKNFLKVIKE